MMKEKLLQKFQYDEYISGESLARELGISRTAVWKQIQSLEQLGYQFDSKKHKGYRLLSRPDIPIKEEVLPFIDTSVIGSHYLFFPSLPSTNSHAKELLKKEIMEGTIIVAEEQVKGRGRKQRLWCSPKGGLWFSVIVFPDIPPQKAMHVTMVASIAVAMAVSEVCRVDPVIKWPNDLLINGKKICGILTELDAEMDTINYSIMGIGLNVNNPIPEELSEIAVSLQSVVGHPVSRVELMRVVLSHIDRLYQYIVSHDLDSLRSLWLEHARCIGKMVSVRGEKETFSGKVTGIDENGCLLLEQDDQVRHVISGDIEYIK